MIEPGTDVQLQVHSFAAERFDDLLALRGDAFWEAHDTTDGAFPLIAEVMQVGPEDNVLDVGCGAGLLACRLARSADRVTGVDLVPDMLRTAQALQSCAGVENVTWQQADVPPLPFEDGAFTLVTTRLCLHHTLRPAAVVAEMARVCAPGGRVVVIDEVPFADPGKARAYNAWERTRDPSHVRFMPVTEHVRNLRAAGLDVDEPQFFLRELDLGVVLENSYPRDDFTACMAALRQRAVDEKCLFGLRQEDDGRWMFNTVDMVVKAAKGRPEPTPDTTKEGDFL